MRILNIIFILFIQLYLKGQCNNFNNTIIVPAAGTINNCNETPPSGPAIICADFNITFSSGNASFYWGYTITNNGVSTTTSFGPINTNSGNFPDIVCVNVPCGASITFFVTAYSNPNGGGSVCNGANATLTTNPFIPLPIELLSFTVEMTEKNVNLNWVTASESNNDYFTIERSINGKYFYSIGEQKGAGNSYINNYYSFIDKNPLQGFNYYRIKQTDFDGQFSFTPIQNIFHATSDINIYPSQTQGQLNINTGLESYEIVIYNSRGQRIKQCSGLSYNQTLSIDDLQSGVYFVEVISGQVINKTKVIKI